MATRAKRTAKGVFISYRRDDSAGEAGRLSDHVATAFGADAVFLDVASLAGGDDWRQRLDVALDACDTMLVVIGRRWLTVEDPARPGARRLDDPLDIVAWEIARGLIRGLRVVQVLVQDAQPVRAEALPSSIAALAMRNAHAIRHESFVTDVRDLVMQVRRARRSHSLFDAQWMASDLSPWARIINSGSEGTVAAIAIVNALELLLARAGRKRRLSVRYLYEKGQRQEQATEGAEGMQMLPALFVASFFGVPAEKVWPYRPGQRQLPAGQTWKKLDANLGECVRGEFFRVDGVVDAIRQLAAGRPVIAACRVEGNSWYEPSTTRSGEIPMPPRGAVTIGLTAVLLIAYDPAHSRFTFMNSWGRRWGQKGLGTMTLDVARSVVDPQGLWSVELATPL